MSETKRTLILGVGNLLMGDEGVGVHAMKELEAEKLPESVAILDGGTGGFHLLSLFQEYDPIILVDATMDGKPIGTVTVTQPRFANDFPRTLSAHDIGLRDLLESAQLVGPLPKLFLITVSIQEIRSMVMELSDPIQRSLAGVAGAVHNILKANSRGSVQTI